MNFYFYCGELFLGGVNVENFTDFINLIFTKGFTVERKGLLYAPLNSRLSLDLDSHVIIIDCTLFK